MSKEKVYYATGRRKTSAARVFMKPGKGAIEVNGRDLENYLKRSTSRTIALQPLELLNQLNKFDLYVTVSGGGEAGQAGAIRHALSRALVIFDAANRPQLKKAGFLMRDPRMVERKKYGQSGARARYQYSKR
ncbi:MAG: 30S ribosomal protein S9 [Bdellovibrionales bacterium]